MGLLDFACRCRERANMESPEGSFSLSSLLCQEDESSLNEEDYLNLNPCSVSVSVSESEYECYIKLLIEKESSFEWNSCVSGDVSLVEAEKSWLKCARSSAIKWILNTRALFGFRHQTAYLSVTYFDRFLSMRSIDNGKLWAVRLLSMACVSLAAKMEECKAPALSQYHADDYNFESSVIKRMELLVLNALEWKMGSITPFPYVPYFSSKCCVEFRETIPKDTVSGAIELILAITKEVNLLDFRPSVIALAAVLAASPDDHLTRKAMDFKMSLVSSCGSLEKEHVYSCYNLMKQIKMEKSETPKSVLLSAQSDILQNSSTTPAAGRKRRLITYNDSDQHCPIKKISQQ